MKIELKNLPEGQTVTLSVSEDSGELDLEFTGVKIISAVEIEARATKMPDTLDLLVNLKTNCLIQCSRCLEEREFPLDKNFRLDYQISKQDTELDINDDIRQEIILDFPLKPLCNSSCKGLCPKCGRNLNEGLCGCGKGD